MTGPKGRVLFAVLVLFVLSACDSFVPAPPTPGKQATVAPTVSTDEDDSTGSIATTTQEPASTQDPQQIATQLRRYLAQLPDEYEESLRETLGPANPLISNQAKLQSALELQKEAEDSFNELRPTLASSDQAKSAQMAALFTTIDGELSNASAGTDVPASGTIKSNTEKILTLLNEVLPAQQGGAAGFTDVESLLDRMMAAIQARQYGQAESLRLDAYATLESGPEAKLTVFAGQLVPPIEGLFWYGQGDQKGLAYLINANAPAADIEATESTLIARLDEAALAVQGSSAVAAVTTNSGIIVFREGLEAVLILASLLGSMKQGPNKRFRKPLSWGAAGAVVGTVATWIVAQGILTALARYGDALEAVVSLIAIGVLLLITNWFFHNVYWTGWIANFHSRKKRLISGEAGQLLGLVLLGFTSIYREGFESVLFLQALVLESGVGAVLAGVAIGLLGTVLVGIIVLALQARLPYKKMLVATGIMIGAVLLVMVGNTVHVLQLVGWLPIHSIDWLGLPYWTGLWFGLYPTWEGILLQIAAGVFVTGSYFLAEHRRDHRVQPAEQKAMTQAEGEAN